ncbi:MAG TPA: PAS domain S-box protein [Allosphingosinicella sp.]|nr:PAS domain S-box protein [Allosphingosinicella sp.]
MADNTRFDMHVGEQRFQLLVNAVTDYALYMLDREGYVATWNPGARRFKGYAAEEIIGQHFSRFFTEEDRAAGVPERALRIAATEGKFETEGWRLRKDGTRMWVHAVIDPIFSDAGELIGFAKITRDITEKREAERALHQSEQRFRMLVQGVHDYAIYMLDPDGRVTNWNSGAERIKGYKAEEIVGRHFSQFYTEQDRAGGEPQRALETALREGKYEREAWRVRSDGAQFFAHVVIDPIYNDDGELLGFAKITRDITERRKAQIELEEARNALFQAQKLQALGELTGGIAHDFNNLMTVIRGSADLLRRADLPDDKRRRYLEAIVETADRAAALTGQLLAFSRRQRLAPEVIDLNLRLDAFGEVVGRTLGGQIEVKLELADSLWLTEADATQLETSLLNAAINARDAMPGGGTLTIRTSNAVEPDGDFVAVEIADTGTGMEEEVLNRAYEPFFTTKPVGKGTGLGLSQIHGFAAQSGGRTELKSKRGEGTTLRILLPRADKSLVAGRGRDARAPSGEGRTVLLVEDNDHVREFAEQLLVDLGYRVVGAACADEALAALERDPVDIVFSDVVMPDRSGVELARIVGERWPRLPVVLATGYSEEVLGGAASEFEILAKPYGADSLSAALGRALAKTAEPA